MSVFHQHDRTKLLKTPDLEVRLLGKSLNVFRSNKDLVVYRLEQVALLITKSRKHQVTDRAKLQLKS